MTTAEPTLAGARARYREIAPVPDPSSPDLGEQLGKYLAMIGQRRAFLGAHSAEDSEAAGIAMAAVLLWHRLESYAEPHLSERAARDIVRAWADAEAVTEWLGKFGRRFGVDASEVNGAAQLEALLLSARQADAEKAAGELAAKAESAGQAMDALDKVIESHERAMYAASVDLRRGDPDAALHLLCLQLDGVEGEPANENETGMEYLNRMRDKRKSEAAAGAKPELAGS